MTAEERIFSIVRGGLYAKLPSLALPLGSLTCREGDVDPAGTDGEAAVFAPGASAAEFLAESDLPERLTLHLLLHSCSATRGGGRGECGRSGIRPAIWRSASSGTRFCRRSRRRLRLFFRPLQAAGEAGGPRPGDLRAAARAAGRADRGGTGRVLPRRPPPLAALRVCFRAEDRGRRRGDGLAGARPEAAGPAAAEARDRQRKRERRLRCAPGCARGSRAFAALLRECSEMRENRHVSGDEFQYAWYLYGLEHYGGMPLIEPLEYSEERRLRELAVVIDTSASCSRSLCAAFLGELAGILTREDLFFERFNLHILECDCEVQQDTRLTTLAELTDWLRTMTLHGGGGTDFRPAFRYVDGLVERGEFAHLPGLLYFTDGYGVFPDVPPAYRAVFVMLRYRYDDIDLPAWAEKLILEAEAPKGDERWI